MKNRHHADDSYSESSWIFPAIKNISWLPMVWNSSPTTKEAVTLLPRTSIRRLSDISGNRRRNEISNQPWMVPCGTFQIVIVDKIHDNNQCTACQWWSGAKVVELTAYRDWKQRAFSETSNIWSSTRTAKTRYGFTQHTTSVNLHHSDLEVIPNWVCYCAMSEKHPKVVYDDFRTEKSPYVTVVHSNPPQTKGRRRYMEYLEYGVGYTVWTYR